MYKTSKFKDGNNNELEYYSLKNLEEIKVASNIDSLPISIRIVIESLLRNFDGKKIREEDITNLANYDAKNPGSYEIPFTVSRIILQDFTGVPLLVDLAAMRDAAAKNGGDPKSIEPFIPVDLVVDHSVQVDYAGSSYAINRNLDLEFIRNQERYEFLKWGQQAFKSFNVIPPGIGIVHQVNLEYLAKGVMQKDGVYFPDTLVGTDSHTTMINGVGVVGWGVGGIEAEAGMLGQPVTFLVPEVIGVNLYGKLSEVASATDLVLHITQLLREYGVVGKFVEFIGSGTRSLSVTDRATIANMAPEYGATIGFFPVDEHTIDYYRNTGRDESLCQTIENYYKAQNLFGIPEKGQINYKHVIDFNLADVEPSVSGPKRPQDRISINKIKNSFNSLFEMPVAEGGFGRNSSTRETVQTFDLGYSVGEVKNSILPQSESNTQILLEKPINTKITNGSIIIAAITSCTNTSNPSVMLAAGLLAKKANSFGLKLPPFVKASLAPGSRVVTDYLERTNLQKELDELGFYTVGYGCTTCIGNSGPLHPKVEEAITEGNLVCASVLSGNRNFEARIHGSIRANFLMSPPLVVAFALTGRIDIDFETTPIGQSNNNQDIYLKDIWPSQKEINDYLKKSVLPESFNNLYKNFETQNPKWNDISCKSGEIYSWDENSTYIQNPPFFDDFSMKASEINSITNSRLLSFFGDSVTTDHISPAGAIKPDSPAGKFLITKGVDKANFNSFGSRRGNDRVMTRGTFGNVRIKNLMVEGSEGGVTKYYKNDNSSGEDMTIYDAALKYTEDKKDLVVIAGKDYGMGSSRDWAAKGTRLLGVKAVIATSFERIHRSNLIGMGVLPLTFKNIEDYEVLQGDKDILQGKASFSIKGLHTDINPREIVTLSVKKDNSENLQEYPLILRLDTPIEIDYYRHGGILPYVLANLINVSFR